MILGKKIAALYFHIPFCKKICPFCSFAIVKDRPEKHLLLIECFKREFEYLLKKHQYDFSSVQSIYFGGGTPSRLDHELLGEIVAWIDRLVGDQLEWSIELNPEDVTLDYAKWLKKTGFTRVSIGVQSFNDSCLKVLGRNHKACDSIKAIANIQDAGFENINLDLLYGYPNQSLASYQNDIQEALTWNPSHLSTYCLSIENKTAVNRRPLWLNWQKENDELIFQMYKHTVSMLQQKELFQYEVSNFSLPGYESIQNKVVWSNLNYLGFGPGAHSFVEARRWGNLKRFSDYSKQIKKLESPHEFIENLTVEQRLDELLLIGLRCKVGINPKDIFREYQIFEPEEWKPLLNRLEKSGLILWNKDQLLLTTDGLFISDEIALTFSNLLGSCIASASKG